jgi:carbamate kinase
MLIVAALHPAAFDAPDAAALEVRVREIARSLAALTHSHTLLVLQHGSRALTAPPTLPADLAAACAVGAIGHLLARELRNALPRGAVLAVQANAVVPGAGPAAGGIGAADPCRFVELDLLRRLAQDDGFVLCVGCVPVGIGADGCMVHSDAELDEDASAACLATELGADYLLLLGQFAAVRADGPATRSCLAAAARFANSGEGIAVIGAATDAAALVAGSAGIRVSRRG